MRGYDADCVASDTMLGKKWKPRYFPLEIPPDQRRASPSPAPKELTSSIMPAAEPTLVRDASLLSPCDTPIPTGVPVPDVVLPLESLSPSARSAQEVGKLEIAGQKEVVSVADVGVDPVVQSSKGNGAGPSTSSEKVKGKKKKSKKDNKQLSTKRELHTLCIICFVDQALTSPCGCD